MIGYHTNEGGIAYLAVNDNGNKLDKKPFQPGQQTHHYRAELRENSITVLIDGRPALSATDNTYLTGKRVGLFSSGGQLSVTGFTVTAL